MKASEADWIFCRLSPMSREAYLPLPIVQAFVRRSRLGDLLPRLSESGCLNGLADSTAYYALC